MADDKEGIVVLVDENGEEIEFEHLDTIEMNGNEYVVLAPLDEEESDSDEAEVIILKVEHNENGDDSFLTVEDDEELDEVFEEFQARMDEQEDDFED